MLYVLRKTRIDDLNFQYKNRSKLAKLRMIHMLVLVSVIVVIYFYTAGIVVY